MINLNVMVQNDVVGKSYWDGVRVKAASPSKFPGPQVLEQHPVLAPYFEMRRGGDAIELGCVPGNWLIYLNKYFDYRVSGVDYSDAIESCRENLRFNGVDADLVQADLLTHSPRKGYELVFSGGVAEHFDDHLDIVRRHAAYAKRDGLVVIVVPNLTHVHWLLCRLFNPAELEIHRLALMYRRTMCEAFRAAGMEVLYCGYHRTFRPFYELPGPVDFVSRGVQSILARTGLDDIGNRFASSTLIAVGVKRD